MAVGLPVEPERIRELNQRAVRKGGYVLYWMQQSQRAEENPALEFAVFEANRLQKPVMVVFGLTDGFPEANQRHYAFLLEGLAETAQAIKDRGLAFCAKLGDPAEVALAAGTGACEIICDRGYTRIQKEWRDRVAKKASCRVMEVEGDVVVPVETASHKAEYAARTIRPKIENLADRFLKPLDPVEPEVKAGDLEMEGLDLSKPEKILSLLDLDQSVGPVPEFFRGGSSRARKLFQDFLENRLCRYAENSKRPETGDISRMSPYLHFGQVSPVTLALAAKKARGVSKEIREAFLEQLIVRRELAMNFVQFTPGYDTFDALPDWAKKTLARHAKDPRDPVYTARALEAAETHDPYWNAAMTEMLITGFMHNYMRMYWAKKILEWSETPRAAFETALLLNNRYFLDGRDPNSFTGVAWTFGLHDRPWKERPVFGTVRYMAASGLERKCDIRAYVDWAESLKRKSP